MEFSILVLIGISLAAMFFGYFLGLFEGRGQGYRRGRKEEALSRTQEPPAPAAAVPQAAATDDQQSLLVRRRDLMGQASVQIDGKQVAASNVSPALRKRLIDLMVTLRPWLEPPGAAQQDEDRIPAENPPGAPPLRSPVATPMSAVRESPAPGAAEDVNAKGVFNCSQVVARHLIAAGRGGKIINTASMAARTGKAPFLAHYVASKYAVVGLTQAMAAELAPHRITVNSICPGFVVTSMQEREAQWEGELRGLTADEVRLLYVEATPLGRLETPEDVAAVAVFLASADSEFMTGVAVDVNGGAWMG